MEKSKKLVSGMLIYAIGNFGTKLLSFFIVPLYTYYISTIEMGTYDLVNSTMSMLFPILTMQISDAAYRWLIRGGGDEYKKTAYQVVLANSCVMTLLLLCINHFVDVPYACYIAPVMVSNAILDVMQKMLRGVDNQRLFAISGVLYTFFFLLLNVIQIVKLRMGVTSLFISVIISNVIVTLYILSKEPKVRSNVFSMPDGHVIKKMISFSLPLVPNQLNWWVMSSSDRYVIAYFVGAAANGIYSIAYKFPSLLQIIIGLFNTSWQDVSIAETEKDGKYYSSVFKQLCRLSFSVLFFLIPLTKIYIVIAMNSEYKEAAKYVAFLYLGTVFQGFSSFYGVGYLRDKNTKQASLTSIYGAVVNLVVNLCLIEFIGIHAAAISTFLGFMGMWIVRERQNRKELGIEISLLDFSIYFFAAVVLAIVSIYSSLKADCILTTIGIIGFCVMNRKLILMIVRKVFKMGV